MKKIGLDVIAYLPKTKHPEEVKKEKSLMLLIISLEMCMIKKPVNCRNSPPSKMEVFLASLFRKVRSNDFINRQISIEEDR